MTIKDFLATENGKRYEEALSGCDKRRQCEYWENLCDYATCLRDNGWSQEDIEEQVYVVSSDCYREKESDDDFVIVIN